LEIRSFAPRLLPSLLPPFPPKTQFGVLDSVKVYFKGFDLFNIKSNFQAMSPMAVIEPERKRNGKRMKKDYRTYRIH